MDISIDLVLNFYMHQVSEAFWNRRKLVVKSHGLYSCF